MKINWDFFFNSVRLKIISELHEVNPIYKDSREFDPVQGFSVSPPSLFFSVLIIT